MQRIRLLFVFLLLATAASAHGPGKENDFGGRRVLLIGIDGCRADALRAAMDSGKAPTLGKLASEGCANWSVFAGGELGGATEQATSSGPGWSTILDGVWRNKHGVSSNKFEQHRIAEFPHFMRRIKDAKPSAWCGSLVDWPEIHDFIADASRDGEKEFLDVKFTVPLSSTQVWPASVATVPPAACNACRSSLFHRPVRTSARVVVVALAPACAFVCTRRRILIRARHFPNPKYCARICRRCCYDWRPMIWAAPRNFHFWILPIAGH